MSRTVSDATERMAQRLGAVFIPHTVATALAALRSRIEALALEDCLWFKGPRNYHCLGQHYVVYTNGGAHKEGTAVTLTDSAGEAADALIEVLRPVLKDARQVAWRRYPEIRELGVGFWASVRIAVWPEANG